MSDVSKRLGADVGVCRPVASGLGAAALLLAGQLIGGCSSAGDPPTANDVVANVIDDGRAWMVGMTLISTGDNELVGAGVDPSVGRQVAIVGGDTTGTQAGHAGHLDPGGSLGPSGHSHSVALPAGIAVRLGAGGPAITIGELVEPLEPGDQFELTLFFAKGADVTVGVTVAGSRE